MRYKFLMICCLLIAINTNANAQTASIEMDLLLLTDAVTYAQAARFVLEAADEAVIADPQEAFSYAQERQWVPKNAKADNAARLDGVALLFMRSFNIKGGMAYSWLQNARYAYREMLYRNIIQGRADPAMRVSGEQLLFITSRMLARQDRATKVSERQLRRQRELEEQEQRRQEVAAALEAARRREALASEINAQLASQQVADTTALATDEGIIITLSNIQFLADSAQLPATERAKLREVSAILATIPDIRLLVAGHTTSIGDDAALTRLSHERAQSVAAYLIANNACRPGNVTTIGFGADRPVADDSTTEGQALNRRVEITILE